MTKIEEMSREADDIVNTFSEKYMYDICPVYLNKFAELIITECVNANYTTVKDALHHFGIMEIIND